ncbi:putative transporter [Aphelenchoides besseyi]|nr:putative transporter [Aphelenchoides besseyi]KAI6192965.1 putative transporter [Aphelenchoides besseyi]
MEDEKAVIQTLLDEKKAETSDRVLEKFGNKNLWLLWIMCSMGFVWTITALPAMISAFLQDHPCDRNATNCTGNSFSAELGSKSQMTDVATSIFLLGNMFGASTIGRLSDLKGRRPTLIASLFGVGVFGMCAAFSPNIYVFMILRFFQGVFLPGCGITNWVLAYESAPRDLRSYAALIFGLLWVFGYCITAACAYLVTHWRYLLIVISTPPLVFSAIYYFTIPESFHFLVLCGCEDQLRRWIRQANKFAKTKVPEDTAKVLIASHHKTINKNEKKIGVFRELFKQKKLVMYTAIVAYMWTCDSFIYFGLTLISTSLAGDSYVNFILSGLVEIPSYFVSPWALEKLGRRGFAAATHFLTMSSFVGVIFIDDETVSLCLWLIGKFGISCAYTGMYVLGSEIFPTVLRSGCIGICVLLERIGGVFAPQVRSMSLIEPHLPNIFFAATSGLAAALALALPETRGKELPDVATEVVEE